jgi:hypothetical protein
MSLAKKFAYFGQALAGWNYFRWLFPSDTWMSLPIAFSLIDSQGGKSKPTAVLAGELNTC